MKYAIGVRKVGSKDIDIIPVEHFSMQHQINVLQTDQNAEQGTYLQQKLALNTSFGTTRSRINNRLRNMMDLPVGTLDVERQQYEKVQAITKLNPDDYPDIPPFDASATEKEDVYPIDKLLSADEKQYFQSCAREVRERLRQKDVVGTEEVMQIMKRTKLGAYYAGLIGSMEKVRFLNVVSLLEVYRMLQYLLSNSRMVRNPNRITTVASEQLIDESVMQTLCEKYLEKEGDEKNYSYSLTNLAKTRLINTAFVIVLHITQFNIPKSLVKFIGVDFQITDEMCVKHLKRIGCKPVNSLNETTQKKETSFTLQVPLQILSVESRRSKKK